MKKPIQFGKYYLLDRINVGGMAEVFKAKAFGVEGFERLLAVKRILPNIAEDEEFITMFIDEAKIAVQLNHANICQIFDLGKVDDSYFIALEFVHGKDLRAIFDRCKHKPVDGQTTMPIAQACFITMKVCEGLDYAHNKRDASGQEMNLVHRDVSPQNVLISYEGEVKLIDFGIAKATGKMSKTQQGILKGKFGYMSPEQVRGLPLDRRSDVFSVGIVLYELLTGERLFVGESDFSTLEKVRNVEILPPSTYNRRISDELERICMKALAKDVEDRYQNAIDLHDDLQAYMYTAGEFYSRKDLAAWMKKVWAQEIEAESAKLESYRHMVSAPQSQPVTAAAGGAPGERPRRSTVPPPPPGALPSTPQAARPSQPHPVVTASGQPANGAAPHVGPEAELAWDDEELATNIYESPPDASDAVVDDTPDAGRLELAHDGFPVAPAPPPAPHRNGTAARAAVRPDFVLPESGAVAIGQPPARPAPGGGRTGMWIAIGAVGVLLSAAAVWLFFVMANEPGQVRITSLPVHDVQVLIDNKRIVEIDATPATLRLQPGSYVLTVQREGYVPWNEQIEVKAGGTLIKHIDLEPLAAGTGFTLVSEPSGAQALLDGNTLEGVTPLKVQGVQPGKHVIEVRGPNHTVWREEVSLEAGKVLDVRAVLPQPGAPAATPKKPEPGKVAATEPKPAPAPEPQAVKEEPKVARPAPAKELPPPPKPEPAKAEPEKPAPAKSAKATLVDEEPAAPQPAKKPEKAAAPAGEGYLRINSKPWTNIAVDGKDTGLHTPQTQLKLPAGSHRITLSNPQFNIKETFSVEIKAGETSTVVKDLRPQSGDTD